MSLRSNKKKKKAIGQHSTSLKHVNLMSSKLEPMIWSPDTGQWKLCFGRCQLTITRVSNIKKGRFKPRLHVSVNLLAGVGPNLAWFCRHLCHCSYVYTHTPMSNITSHDNHEKRTHGFLVLSYMGNGLHLATLLGRWSSAIMITSSKGPMFINF